LSDAALTTVAIPMGDMGHPAARLLSERFAKPTQPIRRGLLSGTMRLGATTKGLVSS
jgi:DNA-binding LacI/PurR family transcriptional regulator